MHLGLRHYYKRKRTRLAPTSMWVRVMDVFIYIIAVLSPALTCVQAYKIWQAQDAQGISLAAWVGYTIFALFWMLYGVIHKEKVIIVTNILSVIANGLVVMGAILYS